MAGKKISELVATTELETTDELILRRASDNKKITGASIASSLVAGATGAIQFNGGGSFAGFGTWDANKTRLLLNSAPFAGLFSLAGVIFAADGVNTGSFSGFNEQTVFFQAMRGTLADPEASHIDDSIGGIEWWGTGSGAAPDTGNPAAVIDVWVDGDVGVGLVPGRIRFRTQGASGLLQERLRIDSKGLVTAGTVAPLFQTYQGFSTTFQNEAGSWAANMAAWVLAFQHAGGTLSAPTVSEVGQRIGQIEFWGTGTGVNDTGDTAAMVMAVVDGNAGDGFVPGRLGFWTMDPTGDWDERLRIDSNGVVSVGSDVAAGAAISVSDFGSSHLVATGYQGILLVEVGSAPQLNFASSHGPDFNSPEAVLNNQRLGEIRFWGYDGTSYSDASAAATIIGYADAQASSVFVPGRLSFSTQGVDAGSPVERLRIDSTGHVIIGKAGAVNTPDIGASDAALIVEGDGTVAGSAGIALNGAGPNTAYLRTGYARGTLAARTAVVDGDFLFDFQTQGYDGSSYESAARMSVRADGDPVDNSAVPSRFEFYTSDSAGSVTERLRIDSKGLVTVGTVAPLFQIAQPGLSTTFQGEPGFSSYAINIVAQTSLLAFQHAGGTLTAPTVSQNGKRLGIIEFWGTGTGVDDTGDVAAFIEANVEGAAGVGFVPGRLGFWTTDPTGDFHERLRISNKGVVSVGIDPAAGASISAADFSSAPLAVTGHAGVLLVEVGLPPQLHFATASGSYSEFFPSSPAAVVSGQSLGEIDFWGHDGTSYTNAAPAASIAVYADATPSNGIVHGRLSFKTHGGSIFDPPLERLRIDSRGRMTIGDSGGQDALFDGLNGQVTIKVIDDSPLLSFLLYSDSVARIPQIVFAAVNSAAVADLVIGRVFAYGHDGTAAEPATEIRFWADADAVNDTSVPGRISFFTQNAAGLQTERLRIGSNGKVAVGQPALSLPNGTEGLGTAYFSILAGGDIPGMRLVTDDGSTPFITLCAMEGSFSVPEASSNDDQLGIIEFRGLKPPNGEGDNLSFRPSAAIVSEVDGVPDATAVPGRVGIQTTGADGLLTERLRLDSLGGAIFPEEFANGADPAAPSSGGRLYIVKTAGGKDQLAVRFPSGAAQIIATEP